MPRKPTGRPPGRPVGTPQPLEVRRKIAAGKRGQKPGTATRLRMSEKKLAWYERQRAAGLWPPPPKPGSRRLRREKLEGLREGTLLWTPGED